MSGLHSHCRVSPSASSASAAREVMQKDISYGDTDGECRPGVHGRLGLGPRARPASRRVGWQHSPTIVAFRLVSLAGLQPARRGLATRMPVELHRLNARDAGSIPAGPVVALTGRRQGRGLMGKARKVSPSTRRGRGPTVERSRDRTGRSPGVDRQHEVGRPPRGGRELIGGVRIPGVACVANAEGTTLVPVSPLVACGFESRPWARPAVAERADAPGGPQGPLSPRSRRHALNVRPIGQCGECPRNYIIPAVAGANPAVREGARSSGRAPGNVSRTSSPHER